MDFPWNPYGCYKGSLDLSIGTTSRNFYLPMTDDKTFFFPSSTWTSWNDEFTYLHNFQGWKPPLPPGFHIYLRRCYIFNHEICKIRQQRVPLSRISMYKPQKVFYLKKYLYNSQQNGAKHFFLCSKLEFSMNFQSGGKTRFENPLPGCRTCRKLLGVVCDVKPGLW